jgi:hypothetical protein
VDRGKSTVSEFVFMSNKSFHSRSLPRNVLELLVYNPRVYAPWAQFGQMEA